MATSPRKMDSKYTSPPLDFSFQSITDASELESEEPRVQGKKKIVKVPVVTENQAENEDDKAVEKYDSHCIKLNNNVLQDLKGFMDTINNIILEPGSITWVDLSFNELTKIDACLCDLPNLAILYLHGNAITDITEADKIAGMPNLFKLSLHGNPMDSTKNYRQYILSLVPQLKTFDFSGITQSDRITASTWKKANPQKKKKKKSEH